MSNLRLLEAIARQISPILGEMVFVGGATTELFFSSPISARVRATRDADVICEVSGRVEYHRLGEKLRELGFREDMSPDAPLCRWRSAEGVLDVMPTDERILGFSNPWYEYGIRTARWLSLVADLEIQVVTPPVFLATKIAAYEGRGGDDLLGSHDVEDIVSVVAFRPEIVEEVTEEKPDLREWLSRRIGEHLVLNPDAETAVVGNIPDARLAPGLIRDTLDRLKAIANLQIGDR